MKKSLLSQQVGNVGEFLRMKSITEQMKTIEPFMAQFFLISKHFCFWSNECLTQMRQRLLFQICSGLLYVTALWKA